MKIHWLAIIATLWGSLTMAAEPTPNAIPGFKVRVRVTAVGENPPAADLVLTWVLNSGGRATTTGDAWSDWITTTPAGIAKVRKLYPNSHNGRWRMRSSLIATGKRPPGNLAIEVESTLLRKEDIHKTPGLLWQNQVGILVWQYGSNARVDTLAGHGRRVYDVNMRDAILPVEDRPKLITFGGRYIGSDHDLIAWSEGVRRLTGLGFNAMHPMPKQVTAVVRQEGITKTWGAAYKPPGYAFNFAKNREAQFDTFVSQQLKIAANAGWKPEDIAFWVTSDEPGWYYPDTYTTLMKDPLAMAAFHTYLQEKGFSPSDFGKADWSEVGLVGRKGYSDREGRMLYYWSNRWVPYASSRFFAEVTRAFEKQMGEGIPVMVNFNNFMGRLYQPGGVGNNKRKKDPSAAMGQHDWLEFGRVRGSTAIATEDWFGDPQAAQWSFYAARMRSAAAFSGVGFGALIIPRTSGQRPDGMPQKILALVGNGAKTIKFFTFGPEYNFPGNCYSEQRAVFKPLSDGMGLVGRAEDLLYPGRMATPEIAILTPQSSQMWDPAGLMDVTNTTPINRHMPYMTETYAVYTAFQHRSVPVAFIDEEGLVDGTLAAHKVLVITAPEVPAECIDSVLKWVEAGGHLVLTAGAARRDRYSIPISTVDDLFHISESTLERKPYTKWFNPVNRGDIHLLGETPFVGDKEKLVVRGWREVLKVTDDRYVTATYPTGTPAALARPLGKGKIFRFAFYPGSAYILTAKAEERFALPVPFDITWRDALHEIAMAAGVDPIVTIDRPLIEAPVLESDLGMAVTLLNWSGKDQPDTVITIRSKRPFARVVTANRADLKVETETNGDVTFTTVTLLVPSVDVLKLYYE